MLKKFSSITILDFDNKFPSTLLVCDHGFSVNHAQQQMSASKGTQKQMLVEDSTFSSSLFSSRPISCARRGRVVGSLPYGRSLHFFTSFSRSSSVATNHTSCLTCPSRFFSRAHRTSAIIEKKTINDKDTIEHVTMRADTKKKTEASALSTAVPPVDCALSEKEDEKNVGKESRRNTTTPTSPSDKNDGPSGSGEMEREEACVPALLPSKRFHSDVVWEWSTKRPRHLTVSVHPPSAAVNTRRWREKEDAQTGMHRRDPNRPNTSTTVGDHASSTNRSSTAVPGVHSGNTEKQNVTSGTGMVDDKNETSSSTGNGGSVLSAAPLDIEAIEKNSLFGRLFLRPYHVAQLLTVLEGWQEEVFIQRDHGAVTLKRVSPDGPRRMGPHPPSSADGKEIALQPTTGEQWALKLSFTAKKIPSSSPSAERSEEATKSDAQDGRAAALHSAVPFNPCERHPTAIYDLQDVHQATIPLSDAGEMILLRQHLESVLKEMFRLEYRYYTAISAEVLRRVREGQRVSSTSSSVSVPASALESSFSRKKLKKEPSLPSSSPRYRSQLQSSRYEGRRTAPLSPSFLPPTLAAPEDHEEPSLLTDGTALSRDFSEEGILLDDLLREEDSLEEEEDDEESVMEERESTGAVKEAPCEMVEEEAKVANRTLSSDPSTPVPSTVPTEASVEEREKGDGSIELEMNFDDDEETPVGAKVENGMREGSTDLSPHHLSARQAEDTRPAVLPPLKDESKNAKGSTKTEAEKKKERAERRKQQKQEKERAEAEKKERQRQARALKRLEKKKNKAMEQDTTRNNAASEDSTTRTVTAAPNDTTTTTTITTDTPPVAPPFSAAETSISPSSSPSTPTLDNDSSSTSTPSDLSADPPVSPTTTAREKQHPPSGSPPSSSTTTVELVTTSAERTPEVPSTPSPRVTERKSGDVTSSSSVFSTGSTTLPTVDVTPASADPPDLPSSAVTKDTEKSSPIAKESVTAVASHDSAVSSSTSRPDTALPPPTASSTIDESVTSVTAASAMPAASLDAPLSSTAPTMRSPPLREMRHPKDGAGEGNAKGTTAESTLPAAPPASIPVPTAKVDSPPNVPTPITSSTLPEEPSQKSSPTAPPPPLASDPSTKTSVVHDDGLASPSAFTSSSSSSLPRASLSTAEHQNHVGAPENAIHRREDTESMADIDAAVEPKRETPLKTTATPCPATPLPLPTISTVPNEETTHEAEKVRPSCAEDEREPSTVPSVSPPSVTSDSLQKDAPEENEKRKAANKDDATRSEKSSVSTTDGKDNKKEWNTTVEEGTKASAPSSPAAHARVEVERPKAEEKFFEKEAGEVKNSVHTSFSADLPSESKEDVAEASSSTPPLPTTSATPVEGKKSRGKKRNSDSTTENRPNKKKGNRKNKNKTIIEDRITL